MGVTYASVLWNKDKKTYDRTMLVFVLIYLVVFCVLHLIVRPNVTIETMLIRAFGTCAFLLLHVILSIGPLARLNPAFLPLLYNRRHLGVTMFILALAHGGLSLFQFHALGNVSPLESLFFSNTDYNSISEFPFQVLGFYALIILFLMAATSHDFWLKTLTPPIWKSLHMAVYLAYALLVAHVFLGIIQAEHHPVLVAILILGVLVVCALHLVAAFHKGNPVKAHSDRVLVGKVGDIPEDRARVVRVGEEEIAVFRYGSKLSAVRNECKHQLGPLGEGKVVDGCITCPWHGYQYRPEDGCSPPPFTEKVSTYRLTLEGDEVFVDPKPLPEGTFVEPVQIA